MTVHLHITPGATARPACCTCDTAACLADDTGEHCQDRGCGTCLHGCPAPAGQRCCLDGEAAR